MSSGHQDMLTFRKPQKMMPIYSNSIEFITKAGYQVEIKPHNTSDHIKCLGNNIPIIDEVTMKRKRIIILVKLQQQVLDQFHNNHKDTKKTWLLY